jgi:tape measure domain-containing protein
VAEKLGSLFLEIDVDNKAALTGLERVKQSALSTGSELKTAFLAFQGAIAGTAIVATVKQIADLAIAAESAGVRLTSLAGRFGESAEATSAAAAAAQQLNLSQTEAANGFSQLYSALRPTGVGLKDIETIFVGVTAAAKNSGLSAESVNNALVQLTQGLASGRLQGDELRSVLEQLPPLSQAIARQLGVSVGSIKQLGSEGKITTDVIIKALTDLKRVELGQLDQSLSTSAERIKALGVAWENLQLSLAKEFGGVGDGLLTGLKAALDFLANVNLTGTQQEIKTVEADIASTTKLITESKEYKLDTTDAEERLRELERRLDRLKNRPDVITTDKEQIYAERLKILNDIQSQEKELFGQGATGLLFGTTDVSGRALLQGFDKAGAKAFAVLGGLQKQIDTLQSEKINLPFDATLQRDEIDKQLASLRAELQTKRKGLVIDTQIEVSQEALAELDRKLKRGVREPGLATERDQLRLEIERLQRKRDELDRPRPRPATPSRTDPNPEDLKNKLIEGSKIAAENLKNAAERFKSAGESLRGSLEGAFKFLTPQIQKQLTDNARKDIQAAQKAGIFRGDVVGFNTTPEELLSIGGSARGVLAAAKNFDTAGKDLVSALDAVQSPLISLAEKDWQVVVNVASSGLASVSGDVLGGVA